MSSTTETAPNASVAEPAVELQASAPSEDTSAYWPIQMRD